jgi:hypothetical protein
MYSIIKFLRAKLKLLNEKNEMEYGVSRSV